MMAERKRDDLIELADAVRELTQRRNPRTHYEIQVLNKRGNRKRTRRTHQVKLPSLLEALGAAIEPGNDGNVIMAGSFESNPSADLAAIAAYERIEREALAWAQQLGITGGRLLDVLPELVSANLSAARLRSLCEDALGWVRIARVATGYDVRFEPDDPCPHCGRKHMLVGTIEDSADGRDTAQPRVFCRECKSSWDETTLGLLSIMLEGNRTRTTLTEDGPCPVLPGCDRRGTHLHSDPLRWEQYADNDEIRLDRDAAEAHWRATLPPELEPLPDPRIQLERIGERTRIAGLVRRVRSDTPRPV